jgi:hypothetical protein
MHTVLSGTLGSNGTFLNSPSSPMMFLYSIGCPALCWSNCSRKKCTFLCPDVKLFSMFLASCWLPNTNMTLEVEDDWLWHSGMTGNMSKVGFGYFGRLGLENAECRMGNIADDAEPIA